MFKEYLRLYSLVALAGVAACSGTSSPSSVPSGAAPGGPASTARSVKPLSSRAIPAGGLTSCMSAPTPAPSATPATGGNQDSSSADDANAFCSHVQIGLTVYGPTTPANQVPGYHPADLQSAYNLPSASAGANQTIGIVVGSGNPNAASDLAVYRSTFALPPCTTASGCFRSITAAAAEKPAKHPPAIDPSWAAEVAIDLDMASAVCPNCKLLLVQAASTQSLDLGAAALVAVQSGATVVSNSYVIPESKDLRALSNWGSLGVPIVAAAGDGGYQGVTNWPASASNVIAVGGTTLTPSSNARGWTESVWSGSGSGCSSLAQKPVWQKDAGCTNRTVADVAAVADPATPVAVYDSYNNAGWVLMAGTSVATPIVAGTYALAGNGALVPNAASLYAHSSALNPIASGNNGTCSVAYLCTAASGYSAPAGLGSPNGIAAF